MDARTTALTVLIAARRQNGWSNSLLKEYIARDRLDRRDAAFCSRLVYGVAQNEALLDWYLGKCLDKPAGKLQPVVLDILRLGAYQILLLDKIPAPAAINEAVEQTKKYANVRASGLVNGVLRSLLRKKDSLGEPADPAIRYSHPKELVALLRENVGEELIEPLLQSDNSVPPTIFQRNPLKAAAGEIEQELTALGVKFERHPWLPDCWLVSGTGDVTKLPPFTEGRVYVQDPAAKLALLASGVEPGMRVLDCCAAPGGKSFAAAMQMENRGTIVSCDIHAHKTALIEKGAERLGIGIIRAMQADACEYRTEWEEAFDAVLADVPCSGLGTIRKKPDVRYKDLAQTARLPEVQRAILDNVCRYVRPGGVLLYSTCTILKRENEAVAEGFLKDHPDFEAEAFAVPDGLELPNGGMATLLPCLHECDGFFICKLRKHA